MGCSLDAYRSRIGSFATSHGKKMPSSNFVARLKRNGRLAGAKSQEARDEIRTECWDIWSQVMAVLCLVTSILLVTHSCIQTSHMIGTTTPLSGHSAWCNSASVTCPVSGSVIDTLLLVSGIESNPGPDHHLSRQFVLAALRGHLATVRHLLSGDPSLVTAKYQGFTALHAAVQEGRTAVVELLIQYGANAEEREPGGRTSLMIAVYKGHISVVRQLIGHGSNLNARDPDTGNTALYDAAVYGHHTILVDLLSAGADVNLQDYYAGATALRVACQEGHFQDISWPTLARSSLPKMA